MKDITMNSRLFSFKKLMLSFTLVLIAGLLFLWLALPGIIQTQAEKYISEKSGHHLMMNKPEFNPLTLSLRLSGLHLTKPDDKPLLEFRELVVDLSANSFYRGAPIFDSIKLDGLEATAILLPDGKLNWSPLLDALKSPDSKPDSSMPRFDVHHLIVSGTKVDFSDQRMQPAFTTRIEPVNLDISELSSFIGERGQYKFTARTATGTSLTLQGTATLQPLSAVGTLALDKLQLIDLSTYFKDVLPVAAPAGIVSASTAYRMAYQQGRLELQLDDMKTRITDIVIKSNPRINIAAVEAKGGHYDLKKNSLELESLTLNAAELNLAQAAKKSVVLKSVAVEEIKVNLSTRQAKLGLISLNGGQVSLSRETGGQLDLVNAMQNILPKSSPAPKSSQPDWHYQLGKFELKGFEAALDDGTARLALQDIGISVEHISDDQNIALPLKAAFTVADGGSFDATGKVTPALPACDIQFKLSDLNLKPVQGYLSKFARLKISNGLLSVDGNATYSPKDTGFNGRFALHDLRLNEAETGDLFLAWKKLSSNTLKVSATKLNIDELSIDGLDSKLHIHKDKSVSIKNILIDDGSKPADKPEKSKFIVNIDKVKFSRGEMDFSDLSLALPFGTRIVDLRGTVNGLSTEPGNLGQIKLDGQVDDFGVARAVGRINLLDPADFMDIKVVFRNIDMNRLTPYSATFAGRKITSGKLSLDLDYKIKQRQLEGKNQVTIDRLVLGDRVASAQAHDLPLDLAIALLQDADGRIDLGLPMTGNLSDPQFSFGGIVWKIISNVISKIASAPFRALGALFGGGDKFEDIAFESGSGTLTPPEREKLVSVAAALNKRPALTVAIQGQYADSDRLALQDLKLRTAVATKSGQHLESNEDPGPLPMHNQKIQDALESLFTERMSGAELNALRDGYRLANPGKLEVSATKMAMGKLSGLFREKKTLSESEVAKLKGTDFYTVLFERMRSKVEIEEKTLTELADNRGRATMDALTNAGAPAARIQLQKSAKIASDEKYVPVKLTLGAASAK